MLLYIARSVSNYQGYKDWFQKQIDAGKIKVYRDPGELWRGNNLDSVKRDKQELDRWYAYMEAAGATPAEISGRKWAKGLNDWFGPGGYVETGLGAVAPVAGAVNVRGGGNGGPLMLRGSRGQNLGAAKNGGGKFPNSRKPAVGEPGVANWRYQRYLGSKRVKGEKPLPFELWKPRHFDTVVAGGRTGRPGGPVQVAARKALEREGFKNVENVKLDGRFPDMVRDNAKGGKDYVEVGRMTKSGRPVSREFEKLDPEIRALGPNDTLTFVNENNLSNRITYHRGDSPR